jgi:hypothetical protein
MSSVGYIWLPADDRDVWNDIERYLSDCLPSETFDEAMACQEEAYEDQKRQFGTTGPMCIVKVTVDVVHSDLPDEPDYDQFDDVYENLSRGY